MEHPHPSDRHESHAATTYQAFLKELEQVGGMSRELAERTAVAVLSVLEQRIFAEGARHLEAQLPSTLRDLLKHLPKSRFGRGAFLQRVAHDLGKTADEAERIVRVVFSVVRRKISDGEARDVAAELPKDLAELWLNP